MASSANPRTDSNRRAQLGLFAGYLAAGLGAVLGAVLLIISAWYPQTLSGLRSMAIDMTASLGQVGAIGRVESRKVFEAIAGYYEAGSRNARLQREIEVARVRLAEARALERENMQLKALLGLAERTPDHVTMARLIGSTAASARRIAFLSAGRRDGVKVGMPVTAATGLVGRVLEVGETSARVLLLTDSESIVPVRRAGDDVVALAEGRADGSLLLRLVQPGGHTLRPGDIFVTSGVGGIYRPGIGVAMVTRVTDLGAIAQLLSNPAATDFVMVEPVWRADAVHALGPGANAPLGNASLPTGAAGAGGSGAAGEAAR